MKTKNKYDDDDGRVIAPMNVDGMPWYVEKTESSPSVIADPTRNPPEATEQNRPTAMTRSETIAFTWGVMKAALLAALIFIGALYAFIMFCIYVWFR